MATAAGYDGIDPTSEVLDINATADGSVVLTNS